MFFRWYAWRMGSLLKKSTWIFAIFFGCALLLPSCSTPLATGYQVYSITEGAGYMSFEYPARIPPKTVQIADDGSYTMIDLYGPVMPQDRTRTRIWVTVTKNSDQANTAGVHLQSALGIAETLAGYSFIDRSFLTLGSEQAEQIVYANVLGRTDFEIKVLHLSPVTMINRQIFLTHDGAVWTISMTASEQSYDSNTPGFNHLISTFKFLD
jgi:hypothetical protein